MFRWLLHLALIFVDVVHVGGALSACPPTWTTSTKINACAVWGLALFLLHGKPHSQAFSLCRRGKKGEEGLV